MGNLFFNFGNEPTYIFFEWVREAGLGDVQGLIVEAFDHAEKTGETVPGEGIGESVHEALAFILDDKLVDVLGFVSLEDGADACHPVSSATLTNQLLHFAALQINFWRVAEALLRDAGKWNPDESVPKVEGDEADAE
jgi:hypothetical protein